MQLLVEECSIQSKLDHSEEGEIYVEVVVVLSLDSNQQYDYEL